MTLEELQEIADKDLKINDSELDLESIKTPQIHNKYMKHLTKFKLMLSKAEAEYNIVKKQKWEYYTGKAPATVYAEKPFNLKLLRQDLDKYIDSDETVIQAKQKVDYLQLQLQKPIQRTLRRMRKREVLK